MIAEVQMGREHFGESRRFLVERSVDGGYRWTLVREYDVPTLRECVDMVEKCGLCESLRKNEYVRIVSCVVKPVMVWKGGEE